MWSPIAKGVSLTEIETRNCTYGDFGIDNIRTDYRFSKPETESDVDAFKRVMPSLRCFNESISIQGDWDTSTAKVLVLLFERCDPLQRKTCKNDTEIKEFIKKKHFIFAHN